MARAKKTSEPNAKSAECQTLPSALDKQQLKPKAASKTAQANEQPLAKPTKAGVAASAPSAPDQQASTDLSQSDRQWRDKGWNACVIKNEDDDGWAVSMTMDGEAEPSLVGPWTMGRDKKNPKPLDANAFATLVKTANEIIVRHQQQTHAALHKSTKVATAAGRVRVTLDIVPDEDNPHAMLSAFDDTGAALAMFRVAANFKFDHTVASAWVAANFAKPKSASVD